MTAMLVLSLDALSAAIHLIRRESPHLYWEQHPSIILFIALKTWGHWWVITADFWCPQWAHGPGCLFLDGGEWSQKDKSVPESMHKTINKIFPFEFQLLCHLNKSPSTIKIYISFLYGIEFESNLTISGTGYRAHGLLHFPGRCLLTVRGCIRGRTGCVCVTVMKYYSFIFHMFSKYNSLYLILVLRG